MTYAETKLGFARKGQGGADGLEPGALGWINFQHCTARPAVDIERRDKQGRASHLQIGSCPEAPGQEGRGFGGIHPGVLALCLV